MIPQSGLFRAASFAAVVSTLGWLPGPLSAAGGKWTWPTIPAEERAAQFSPVEKDAPAEVLDWIIDRDEREYPDLSHDERYIRYKIYDPKAVESIAREIALTHEIRTAEIFARLTLPDGTVREFGAESVKEKVAARKGRAETKEKFLAVPGIQAGAILEFRIVSDYGVSVLGPGWEWYEAPDGYMEATQLQLLNVPVRHAELRWRTPRDDFFDTRLFVVNAPGAKVENTRKMLRLTVTNLPARLREPQLGPVTDYAATALWSCVSTRIKNFAAYARETPHYDVDTLAGDWAPFASFAFMLDEARGRPNGKLRKFAAELCAGTNDPEEKARRIHAHVQKLFLEFDRKPTNKAKGSSNGQLTALDLLLDPAVSAKLYVNAIDYFWLAVALYRSADLDVRVALLPDRKLARFQKDQVAQGLLPHICAAVRIGDAFKFSYPIAAQEAAHGLLNDELESRCFLPFGQLPWNVSGQVALLGILNRQEFIPVPPVPADQSRTTTIGVFQLDAEGNLRGAARRQFTGQEAAQLREKFFDESDGKQREALLERIRASLGGAEVQITKLTGVADPEKPIEAEFKVTWPGFAVAAGDRLIFRPSVFRREVPAPFPADKRRNPIHFPFPFEQMDSVGIQLPPGYKPEELPAPSALPGSKALAHAVKYSFDEKRRLLTVRRDFTSSILDVPADAYPKFKGWFDAMTTLDQQEVVFVQKEPEASAAGPVAK